LANNIIMLADGKLANVDLSQNLTDHPLWQDCIFCHTDIPRMKAGMVGAQVMYIFKYHTFIDTHYEKIKF
jgi:hypothetical protein